MKWRRVGLCLACRPTYVVCLRRRQPLLASARTPRAARVSEAGSGTAWICRPAQPANPDTFSGTWICVPQNVWPQVLTHFWRRIATTASSTQRFVELHYQAIQALRYWLQRSRNRNCLRVRLQSRGNARVFQCYFSSPTSRKLSSRSSRMSSTRILNHSVGLRNDRHNSQPDYVPGWQ